MGAAPKKICRPGEWHGASEAGAIDMALKPLPGQLAIRQQPDSVAHRPLGADEVARHQPQLARRGEENPVVVDQRVVEIDADPHASLREPEARHIRAYPSPPAPAIRVRGRRDWRAPSKTGYI